MISRTTKEFWNLFDVLPKGIQNQAVKAYKAWNNYPNHPGLHFKSIHNLSNANNSSHQKSHYPF